jgi:hypothetical protein
LDDKVEVEPVADRLVALRVVALVRVVAGVARLGVVDRHAPGAVGGVVVGGAGGVVQAQVVGGAVGRGDLEVLAVPQAVGRSGEPLDPGAVVGLEVVLAVGVADQLTVVGAELDGGVPAAPALVAGVLDALAVAALVGALDEPGAVGPAVADPGGL